MGNISILSREEIGRDYTEARTLKRKLNNGDWVYVSEVLNELVENKIMIKKPIREMIISHLSSLRISYLKLLFLIDVNGIVAFTISIFLFVIKGSPFWKCSKCFVYKSFKISSNCYSCLNRIYNFS